LAGVDASLRPIGVTVVSAHIYDYDGPGHASMSVRRTLPTRAYDRIVEQFDPAPLSPWVEWPAIRQDR